MASLHLTITIMTSAAAIVGEDTPRHHNTQNNTHKSNGKETGSKGHQNKPVIHMHL